jgi:hypothetical protein
MSLRIPVVLVLLGAPAAVALALLVLTGPGDSRVGETIDLPVEAPRYPLRWEDDRTVVYQGWTSVVTVRLDGSVVATEPSSPQEAREPEGRSEVDADARFGRWRAWGGGHYLFGSDDERCIVLVPSPDGTYVACQRIVTDFGHETSEAFASVIRIR